FEGRVYGDYIQIAQFNKGVVLGVRTSFAIDTLFLDIRLERSLFKDHFLPNYYNSLYERDRYNNSASLHDFITKATILADSTTGDGNGFRFQSFLSVNEKFQASISYLHFDNLD